MESPLNGKLISVDKFRTETYRMLYDLYKSVPQDNYWERNIDNSNYIMLRAMENSLKISHEDYVCDDTIKVLNFCNCYYKYVGIRTPLPEHYKMFKRNKDFYPFNINGSIYGQPYITEDIAISDPKGYKKTSDIRKGIYNRSPAIWEAVKLVDLDHTCGNSHQYQINDNLSTGLYVRSKDQWYKVKK